MLPCYFEKIRLTIRPFHLKEDFVRAMLELFLESSFCTLFYFGYHAMFTTMPNVNMYPV